MNTRTLEYIIAVYETKSFILASEKCYISQPALSMQIKKFEELYGIQIFERQSKNIIVTNSGKTIISYAYKILQNINDLKKNIEILKKPENISITIGAFPTLCPYIMPIIIPLIKKHLPNIKLSVIEEKTDVLVQMLNIGSLDFALLAKSDENHSFTTKTMFKDDFYVAVSIENKLSKFNSINLDEIKKHNLMILDEGHCLRDQTIQLCSLDKINNNQFKGTSLETLRQMVSINEGIAIIPKIACIPSQNIVYIPIDNNRFYREIDLVCRKTSAYLDVFNNLSHIISQQNIYGIYQ